MFWRLTACGRGVAPTGPLMISRNYRNGLWGMGVRGARSAACDGVGMWARYHRDAMRAGGQAKWQRRAPVQRRQMEDKSNLSTWRKLGSERGAKPNLSPSGGGRGPSARCGVTAVQPKGALHLVRPRLPVEQWPSLVSKSLKFLSPQIFSEI